MPLLVVAIMVLLQVGGSTAHRAGANPRCADVVVPAQQDCADPRVAWPGCYAGGFNASDSTAAVQGALSDAAKPVVVIPAAPGGAPWPVLPLTMLKAAGQNRVVVLQPGAVLEAKRWAFQGRADALLHMDGASNVTLCGKGAVMQMWRADYNGTRYNHSEWRHGLSLWNAADLALEDLTVRLTGGDGVYVHGVAGLFMRNVTADRNYRQGMSITDATDVLVTNCTFSGTDGTNPRAGVDLEPNTGTDRLTNVTLEGCLFSDNAGSGMQAWLGKMDAGTAPISVTVRDSEVRGGKAAGLMVGGARAGLRGSVTFTGVRVAGTRGPGLALSAKSAHGPSVTFQGGSITHTGSAAGVLSPVELLAGDRPWGRQVGGVAILQSAVVDSASRPWLVSGSGGSPPGTTGLRVSGVNVTTPTAAGCRANLSLPLTACDVHVDCIRPGL